MDNHFFTPYNPEEHFTEQQKKSLQICIDSMSGLSYFEAEQVFQELYHKIKTASLVIPL